ncbi:hypothetical protein [Anaerocolumna sp. MB42-C2]|uniref:hypothetical protein n=1 Tax=Anaerocolumna sp. MB42-C2 TaxID=3070997 RepID=UPI0027DEECFE|nr:hypothetical protein [Anaerocolumna sp. MB42-C2]WMJ88591.1 hypothetical protein RBU59_03490 [Anaerocolumna sp. MB42-C2]
MKNKIQLKGLIIPALVFFSLLIILLNYQLVYKKNSKDIKEVKTNITTLSETLSDLQAKQANRDSILKENESLTQQINTKIVSYGSGTTEEKSIVFISEMEKNTDIKIDTAIFSKPEYFLNGNENDQNNNSNGSAKPAGTDTTDYDMPNTSNQLSEIEKLESDGEENETNSEQIHGIGATKTIDMQKIKGYRSTLTITFKVSYDGLKRCIDYINNYPEKRNIDEITLAYDSETGNLTGSMKINMYNLIGTGREYTEPILGGTGIGLDNIFGTIDFNPN